MQARSGLVLGVLDHVDAAGVGAGDVAALLEDQAEQPIDVALARDRACDLDELTELVAVASELLRARSRLAAKVEPLEQPVQREADRLGRGGRGQERERCLRREALEPDGRVAERKHPAVAHLEPRDDRFGGCGAGKQERMHVAAADANVAAALSDLRPREQ